MSAPKDTPTALMQRIAAASSGTGMHFAGIPMSAQKAATVGTAIFYLTKYFATTAGEVVCKLPPAPPQPWWNGTAVVFA